MRHRLFLFTRDDRWRISRPHHAAIAVNLRTRASRHGKPGVSKDVTRARSAGELVAYYDRLGKRLRIEVRDNSAVGPHMQDRFTARRAGGLGLRIVDTLASSWGMTATATGKTVWFELEW